MTPIYARTVAVTILAVLLARTRPERTLNALRRAAEVTLRDDAP